jgi:hypothetical protein
MNMELLLSVCVGLGLAAACGFRVFVPLLVTSIAAHSGHLTLAPSFDWVGSPGALAAFSLATALEISAYYVPWLDNFLDTLATPAAIVAGSVVTASMVTDVSPFLKWSLAVIAGGGVAAVVQTSTVLARGLSLVSTGGMANPIVATAELGGSFLTAIAAVLAPVLAILLVFTVLGIAAYKFIRRRMAGAPPIITPRLV